MRREFVFLLISRALSGLAAAYAAVLLARGVGPGLFGIFGAVVSASTTIMTFAGLGLPTLIAKQRAIKSPLLGQTLRLNGRFLLFGAAVGVCTAIFISRASWRELPALVVVVLALCLEAYADSLLSIPIADGARWTAALNIVVRRVTLVGFVLLSPLVHIDALALYAVGYFSGCAIAVLLSRRYCRRKHVVGEPISSYKERLGEAWPYALSNGSAATRSLDTLIVSSTVGSIGAGNYAAASRLTTPFYLIPSALTQVLMPHVARADKHAVKRIGFGLSLAALLSYILIAPFAIFSSEIVMALLGPDFASADSVLRWTLIAMPVVALSSPLGTLLQSQDCERFVGINGVVFAIVSIVAMVCSGVATGSASAVAIAVFVTYSMKCASLFCRIVTIENGS
jgi:O-antigen/teichoic acid export membrane protein